MTARQICMSGVLSVLFPTCSTCWVTAMSELSCRVAAKLLEQRRKQLPACNVPARQREKVRGQQGGAGEDGTAPDGMAKYEETNQEGRIFQKLVSSGIGSHSGDGTPPARKAPKKGPRGVTRADVISTCWTLVAHEFTLFPTLVSVVWKCLGLPSLLSKDAFSVAWKLHKAGNTAVLRRKPAHCPYH